MPLPSHLKALLGRSLTVYPVLAELTGSLAAGLLLSQALYWATRTKDADGWFYKTQDDWAEETGLTRAEQNKARTKLRGLAFWQEQQRGVTATLHYRVDFPLLTAALAGQDADVTLEQVLAACATTLKQLSKTSYMRARKAQAVAEFVDFTAVLRAGGMTCGICGQPILRPLGLNPVSLTIAYLLPLTQGGSHTWQNLHPVHVACAAPKSAEENHAQLSYGKQTCSLTTRRPVVLR